MLRLRRSLFTAASLSVFALPIGASHADDTGFASMHSMTKSGGLTCFSDHAHAGSGTGKTKQAAFNAALKDWWSYTAGEYGSDWAQWRKSASKSIKYSKAEDGWSATIESRPCK